MTNERRSENFIIIEFNNLIVNYSEQVVSYKDVEIQLTNREFQVLYFLMRHQGQVFSKAQDTDGSRGRMVTGWNLIDGKWYYFNTVSDGTRGALFVNCKTPDGYRVDAYGC